MGRKPKIIFEEKLNAVEDYLDGRKSPLQICLDLQIDHSTLRSWIRKYHSNGKNGLKTVNKNTYYPETLKMQAVSDYLKDLGSLSEICSRYNISSHSILLGWIKKYNSHEISKSHKVAEDKNMTNGRKTTYEERVEIVAFCTENDYDYDLASKRFDVSYQQVYTWVKKYQEYGYEALIDKRGKRKEADKMSDSQKLAAQLKLLESENRRLKMENDFLKKLEELKRRR